MKIHGIPIKPLVLLEFYGFLWIFREFYGSMDSVDPWPASKPAFGSGPRGELACWRPRWPSTMTTASWTPQIPPSRLWLLAVLQPAPPTTWRCSSENFPRVLRAYRSARFLLKFMTFFTLSLILCWLAMEIHGIHGIHGIHKIL